MKNIKKGYKFLFNNLLYNRSIKQTLLKNTFWLMVGEGLAKFILFLVVVISSRYLGVERYGVLSFALSFTTLFGIIVDFGFNNYITRELSQNNKNVKKYIENILVVKLLLSVLTFIIIAISIKYLHEEIYINILIYESAIYVILQSFINFFQFIFQAYEKMQYVFLTRVLYTLFLFLFIIFVVFGKLPLQAFTLSYILASLLSLLVIIYITIKYFTGFFIETDLKFWKSIITESWPFFAGALFTVIYANVDVTLISIFRNFQEVGLYQAADKVLNVFVSITLIHQVLYPKLSSLYNQQKMEVYKKIMRSLFTISFFILIPFGLLTSILSKEILFIIYGKEFISANSALTALIWTGILGYFNAFWGNTLMIMNKQLLWFYAVLIGAIVNVALNLIIIPKFGFNGAADVTIFSELVIVFVSYIMCPKNIRNF